MVYDRSDDVKFQREREHSSCQVHWQSVKRIYLRLRPWKSCILKTVSLWSCWIRWNVETKVTHFGTMPDYFSKLTNTFWNPNPNPIPSHPASHPKKLKNLLGDELWVIGVHLTENWKTSGQAGRGRGCLALRASRNTRIPKYLWYHIFGHFSCQ